jgi:hypothetical protein
MSTIVEATVPDDQFALSETFDRAPGVAFRVVRLVAHGTGDVMPFLWADCEDPEELADMADGVAAHRLDGARRGGGEIDPAAAMAYGQGARVALVVAVEHAHQRALAGPGRADERDRLAGLHRQRHAVEHRQAQAILKVQGKGLGQAADADHVGCLAHGCSTEETSSCV